MYNLQLKSLLILVIFLIQQIYADYDQYHPTNYCKTTNCYPNLEKDHVMCKYPKPGPSKNCKNYIPSNFTCKYHSNLVELHNNIRKELPVGIKAPRLYWDFELSMMAQRWSDQCLKGTDSCRNTLEYLSRVEQNIGEVTETVETIYDRPACDFSETILGWIKQNDNPAYPRGSIHRQTFNRVGCGITVLRKEKLGKTFTCRIVCNYGKKNDRSPVVPPYYLNMIPKEQRCGY